MTLKQSQGHQTYNDNVDPKQDFIPVQFERDCFLGVQEKPNVKDFFKRGNMSIVCLEHVRKKK